MIELVGIRKHYLLSKMKLDVIQGIDLKIEQGEFVSIMGKSGSGKSTLLNIIGCLDLPSEGIYRLFGKNISKLDDTELSDIRNKNIGFIFQSFNLIMRNTAKENVEKPLIYQGIGARERSARAHDMLQRVGLSDRADHFPSQLSGGQQQRVSVARALITNPNLIIADEPTGNLDSRTGVEIMGMLRQMCDEGKTVLMVTHDPALAEMADRLIKLSDGRITS